MLYIIVLLFAVHTKFIAKIDENSNHLPSDDSLVTSLVTQNCEKDIKIQQLLKSLEEQTLYSKHIKLENDKIKNENEKLKNNKAEALLIENHSIMTKFGNLIAVQIIKVGDGVTDLLRKL